MSEGYIDGFIKSGECSNRNEIRETNPRNEHILPPSPRSRDKYVAFKKAQNLAVWGWDLQILERHFY